MKKYLPYIIIALLSVSLAFSLSSKREVIVEDVKRDTIVDSFYVVDTFFCDRPIYNKEVVVDTIFIDKVPQNGLKLPITQRIYTDERYKAWVSGYNPSLDSINVYQKTLTNTIEIETTKYVYPKTTDFYLNAGGNFIGSEFAPSIGATVKLKNDMTLGADLGYYKKSVYCGFNIGFKINK